MGYRKEIPGKQEGAIVRAITIFLGLALVALPVFGEAFAAESDRHAARIEKLIAAMTIDEKLGQLVQLPGGRQKSPNSRINDEERARVRAGLVGSYLNVAGADATQALQRVAVEESRLGVPLLFAMDVIHGYRTIFPVPLALASSWDESVVERAARIAAVEASASGLHWTFAPMVDVARDPRWGRIVEGAGEDAFLGSAMAAAQVRGFQTTDLSASDTILATTKHFAAYGAAVGGRDYSSADISERSLHEVYLPPFFAAARAGSGSFMSAFNDIGGLPVNADRGLLRDILRDRWRWDGVLISDWMAVDELRNHGVAGSGEDAATLALGSGVDVDMASNLFVTGLRERIARDPSLLPLVDAAVRRMLAAKARLGLFDDPYRYSDGAREAKSMLTAEHRSAAREAARRSIVLLKNDGDLLPLAANIRRMAVVGALADDADSQLGSWRARGEAGTVKPLIPALREALPAGAILDYAPGASPRSADPSGIPAAVDVARRADLVLLVVGEHFDLSGEARSRSDLALPGAQQALAEAILDTGKPIVVLLVNGRPLAIDQIARRAPAILETWFLGIEAGPAIADVLLGRVSPGGKLPVSFPRATGAVPFYYNHLPSGRPADPDLATDTARYHDLPITPLFPFGHGLSYADFEYRNLKLDRESVAADEPVTLSIEVRNRGRRAADEVVQLYVRDPVARVSRPVQELRGFRRITLAPGERKRVTFTLRPAQLAFWGPGRWIIEPGLIEVSIGSSSADIRARGSFTISTGGDSDVPAASLATPSSEARMR
jgi:beta-glucosidase